MAAVREALEGRTLETRKTESRREAMAWPTRVSDLPLPYISAVSMRVMPKSRPRWRAAISSARREGLSPMRQVPWPSAGSFSPEGRVTVGMVGGMGCTSREFLGREGNRDYLLRGEKG